MDGGAYWGGALEALLTGVVYILLSTEPTTSSDRGYRVNAIQHTERFFSIAKALPSRVTLILWTVFDEVYKTNSKYIHSQGEPLNCWVGSSSGMEMISNGTIIL